MSVRRHVLTVRAGSARTELPVSVVTAARPGPTVVVTGNVHGDEVCGVYAAQQLLSTLPDRLSAGRVVVYPSLNPLGLSAGVRTVGTGGPDLNRCFPGEGRGLAGSIARTFWADLERHKPDLVVDLHADSASAIPYVIVDRAVRYKGAVRAELEARLARLAEVTGLTVLDEYPDDQYTRFQLDRSLSGAVVNRLGIPALTVEVGPRRHRDPAAVSFSEQVVWRLLAELGLCEAAPPPPRPLPVAGSWQRAAGPRARSAGLFRPLLAPGTRFETGDVLGELVTLDGERLETVAAPAVGIVVAWPEGAWIDAGAAVGTLGLETAT